MSKLIVIEGLDGVGSTTQTKLLCDYLLEHGYSVVKSAEPTNTILGQEIRRLLKDTAEKDHDLLACLALCFAADRMQHLHQVIKPAIAAQKIVILDRYVTSSFVYQGLHLPQVFIQEINKYALKSDYTIILDLDADEAFQRIKNRSGQKDFYETLNNLKQIRNRYHKIYADDPKGKILIDASGSIEQVQERILNVLTPILAMV